MQIHELNTFSGTPSSSNYLAIDDGTDTGKISGESLLAPVNTRIDNLVSGVTVDSEVIDGRVGADGVTYGSLGTAIRTQVSDLKSELTNYSKLSYCSLSWEHGGINITNGELNNEGALDRSRVVAYIDTKDVLTIINNTAYNLWPVFYKYDANTDTYVYTNNGQVEPYTSISIQANHGRYMCLDYRSSIEDASGVSVLLTSLKNDVSNSNNSVARLLAESGIATLPYSDFFLGTITVTNGSVSYQPLSSRVATRNGITYPLEKGDVICLADYADKEFNVVWEVNGTWDASGWIASGEYRVSNNGNYQIVIRTNAGETQSGVEALASLVFIKRNTLVSYVEDLVNVVEAGLKPLNTYQNEYRSQPKPLVLMHFSDIHGDVEETDRINSVYQNVVNLCDDVICTGDLVEARFSNNASFITDKGFLLCIGNHDALTDPSGWDWSQMATQSQLYEKFFADGIASWGVTYTANQTYYYKDYTSKEIRLIVLNNFLSDEDFNAQKEWLTNVLNDAITNRLSVVIAMHYHPKNIEKVASNFTKIDGNPSSQSAGGSIEYRVDQFIQNGGKFICYLTGHEHKDFILKSSDYPEQLAISIDATSVSQSNQFSDLNRKYGDKSQDLYNLTIFDTSTKTIKIVRAGCDIDNYLRSRKVITIKYDTADIIYEG